MCTKQVPLCVCDYSLKGNNRITNYLHSNDIYIVIVFTLYLVVMLAILGLGWKPRKLTSRRKQAEQSHEGQATKKYPSILGISSCLQAPFLSEFLS